MDPREWFLQLRDKNSFHKWDGITHTVWIETISNVDTALYLNVLTLKCTGWVRTTGVPAPPPYSI